MTLTATFLPTPGSTITATTPLVVTVGPAASVGTPLFTFVYPDGTSETPLTSYISSAPTFTAQYTASTMSLTGGNQVWTFLRTGGFLQSPTINATLIDSAGSVTNTSAAWNLPASVQAYATPQDFSTMGLPPKAYGGVVPIPDLQRALVSASADIDSYMQSQYQLPLQSWSVVLNQRCVDLAMEIVMDFRGLNPESSDSRNIRERADRAREWLRGVAGRRIHPVVQDSAVPAGSTAAPSGFSLPSSWDYACPGI